jgi:hypothetical protein
MAERMTTQDIFKNCSEIKEAKADWKRMYAAVASSLQTKKYRMMRNGNTLFWFRIESPGVARVFVFNADSYKNLFRNMKDFAKAMEIAKYKTWYGVTQDMNMINLLKRIGYSVDVEKMGKDGKGRQLYRGTVHV